MGASPPDTKINKISELAELGQRQSLKKIEDRRSTISPRRELAREEYKKLLYDEDLDLTSIRHNDQSETVEEEIDPIHNYDDPIWVINVRRVNEGGHSRAVLRSYKTPEAKVYPLVLNGKGLSFPKRQPIKI